MASYFFLSLFISLAASRLSAPSDRPPHFKPGKDMNYFQIPEDQLPSDDIPVHILEAQDPEGKNVTFPSTTTTTN
jgi:hypothetical protein